MNSEHVHVGIATLIGFVAGGLTVYGVMRFYFRRIIVPMLTEQMMRALATLNNMTELMAGLEASTRDERHVTEKEKDALRKSWLPQPVPPPKGRPPGYPEKTAAEIVEELASMPAPRGFTTPTRPAEPEPALFDEEELTRQTMRRDDPPFESSPTVIAPIESHDSHSYDSHSSSHEDHGSSYDSSSHDSGGSHGSHD